MTKQIELRGKGKGLYIIVDDDDFEKVSSINWYLWERRGQKYAQSRDLKKCHRYILNPPHDSPVDHINGNGLDNRKGNLRVCTLSQNARNKKDLYPNKKVLFRGVSLDNSQSHRNKPYLAKITLNYKTINLGRYRTAEEAARAWDKKAYEISKEFCVLNFPKI